MEIRVLGCHGAQLPGYNTTSFLLDTKILIDAGTVTSILTIDEQIEIDYILVTHSHLDHVKDIAFLADNLHRRKQYPVDIISTQGIIDILRSNLFNSVVWPDFSIIPDEDNPVIRFRPIEPGRQYPLNSVIITPVVVHHVVETVAYVVDFGTGSVIFVGDTGPTEGVWKIANARNDVKAIFIETSFPNDMIDVAEAAGHFTPASLNEELTKLTLESPDIYLYHLKPQYYDVITREVGLIKRNKIRILNEGEIIHI